MFKYCLLMLMAFICLDGYANSRDITLQQPNSQTIKIINIGDSITQGGLSGRAEYTYRRPLYALLKKNHFPVDFIGTRQAGVSKDFYWPKDFDLDHEGYYGATTVYVSEKIKHDLEEITAPDIAIIDLGSNDQHSDVSQTVIKPLEKIIFSLRGKNPDIKIIVVQIPGFWQNLNMHYKVWLMATRLSTKQSPIVTAPLYRDWDTKKDTYDGAHPNTNGQIKMANLLYSKLVPLLTNTHH